MIHQKLIKFIDEYSVNVSINGVYCIYHIQNKNMVYIGSTCRTIRKKIYKNGCYGRWIEHYSLLLHNNHYSKGLQDVVNKFGISGLRFKVLESLDSNLKEYIREREEYWIKKLNTFEKGYNSSLKTIGTTPSKEIREQMSKFMKTNNPMFNRDIVIKSIISNREFNLSKRKNVIQFNKSGEYIREWSYCDEASKILKVDSTNIFKAASGIAKSSAGYIWIFKEDFTEILLKEKIKGCLNRKSQSKESILKSAKAKNKIVYCYNKGGNFIKKFNSIKEASIITGIDKSNISSVCGGRQKTAGGYIWSLKSF